MDIFNKIINEAAATTLSKARKNVDKNPTDGQKEAGNYRKGHVNVLGFQITIENPKGSYRKGKDKDGHEWKTLMHNDYGYFVRTLGKDGDAIDVFIGPNLKSQKIFPIDQFVNGEFDETKVMLGFDNKEEAKAAYLSNYEKDWKGFKYITEVDIDTFKKWLYDGYRQRKPFAKYARLTENHNTTIKNIVKKSTLCEATNPNDEIWYRGYESQFGFNGTNKNILWLTDDIDYARCYGDRVVEVVIDGNKLNPASIDEMDELCGDNCEFDYYDGPDDNTIVAAMKEGFNCYCFYANDDSSYCMCLWDNSVIKSVRELSEEETNAIEGYDGYDITPYRTSLAESKKQRKNDEGKVVPEKCECGGDVVLQIHGEPVFVCDKCGKYYGTLPFSKKLNESIDIKKALKNLKKRRDPANIENWNSKMINEAQGLKSKKLYDIFKQYGRKYIAKHYDSSEAMDLHNVLDDDVVGVFRASKIPKTEKEELQWIAAMGYKLDKGDAFRNIELAKHADNGEILYAVVINRNANFEYSGREGGFKDYAMKKRSRENDRKFDGAKDYQWKGGNEISHYTLKNPYYKEWSNDSKNNMRQKIKDVYGAKSIAESKEHKPPKDVAAAIRKANRDADIESHGKATDFRTTITKNPKTYSRKEKHKKQISENILRQIIRESIEEFYKGSRKEKAAYENACDCLYYGYGFKFWFERNSELLDGDVEFAKKIWCQAKEDLANDF